MVVEEVGLWFGCLLVEVFCGFPLSSHCLKLFLSATCKSSEGGMWSLDQKSDREWWLKGLG